MTETQHVPSPTQQKPSPTQQPLPVDNGATNSALSAKNVMLRYANAQRGLPKNSMQSSLTRGECTQLYQV